MQVILMMDGHNSFIYANPSGVFSILHAVFASMRIRMCSEYYVCCVHMYTHTVYCSVAVTWWELQEQLWPSKSVG